MRNLSIQSNYICFSCTDLTDPPVSKCGLLYTIVEFSCKGIGDGLIWTVAHSTINDAERQKQNITVTTSNMSGNISSNLTIPALPSYNNIDIGCIVISDNPFDAKTQEAVLTVTGY